MKFLFFKGPRRKFIVGSLSAMAIYAAYKNRDYLNEIGIVRFARVGVTATIMMCDYKWNMMGMDYETPEYKQRLKQCHVRGAKRILELAKKNGGVFIKVGQHVASLQYLLPTAYTSTLSVLHSRAPESKLEDLKKVIQLSLNTTLDDLFVDFEQTPFAAASLATVHVARLKTTNEKVAVKIQHPKVKARSYLDLATMEFFVRVGSKIFPDFKLMWLVEETKKNLPLELDFLHEANNAERVKNEFSHLKFLKVPKIYWNHSSDMVLTMEFCEGGQIDDLNYIETNKLDKHEICRNIGRLYSEMIFVKGYIHCDPHPGNVLVRKNAKNKLEIVLLDHGLYLKMNNDLRVNYSKLWLALMKPDQNEILRICNVMGLGEYSNLFACIVTLRSWRSINTGISKVQINEAERREIKDFASSLIPQISNVLDRMPRQLLLVLKTNDLLRSISHKLNTQNRLDSFIEMNRCCTKSVYHDAIQQSKSRISIAVLYIKMLTLLGKIYIYEKFLTIREFYQQSIGYIY